MILSGHYLNRFSMTTKAHRGLQMRNDPANPTPVRLGMDTAAEYDSSTYLS
jgi:hypothetical protein